MAAVKYGSEACALWKAEADLLKLALRKREIQRTLPSLTIVLWYLFWTAFILSDIFLERMECTVVASDK